MISWDLSVHYVRSRHLLFTSSAKNLHIKLACSFFTPARLSDSVYISVSQVHFKIILSESLTVSIVAVCLFLSAHLFWSRSAHLHLFLSGSVSKSPCIFVTEYLSVEVLVLLLSLCVYVCLHVPLRSRLCVPPCVYLCVSVSLSTSLCLLPSSPVHLLSPASSSLSAPHFIFKSGLMTDQSAFLLRLTLSTGFCMCTDWFPSHNLPV